MSKIGDKPVISPKTVSVELNENRVNVKGKDGTLSFEIPRNLKVLKEAEKIIIKTKNEEKKTRSIHGLFRQLVANAVLGVENPWQKRLEVVGTGFNVKLQGEDLIMKLGYSHPVVFKKIANIQFKTEGNNKIVVLGVDKQLVGQVAYLIKILKKPDAYKGKGIRYEGEVLKLKPGKKVKTTTTGA